MEGRLQVLTRINNEDEEDQEDKDIIVPTSTTSLGGRMIYISSSPAFSTTTAATTTTPKSTMMTFDSVEEKAHVIRQSLQLGNESNTINLWELRELALSKGGLLSPTFRRLAWPKMIGVSSEKANNNNDLTNNEDLSPDILHDMKDDIGKVVWCVSSLICKSMSGKDEFWYSPLYNNCEETEAAPGLALTSPCSGSAASEEDSQESSSHAESLNKKTLMKEHQNRLSPQEQAWLEQVLVQVIANHPTLLKYQKGLANLAALLMVNVESTSLASHLLSQLLSYTLYGVFTADISFMSFERMLTILMKKFKTTKKNFDVTEFSAKALTWFASDNIGIDSFQVISRLFDACIVSHPLFPLYFGTAASECQLPWTFHNVETSISAALDFMDELPPSELLVLAKNNSLLPPPPSWAVAATVTTDWIPSHSIPSPPRSPAKRQQAVPFSDDDSDANWERLSTVSEHDFIDDNGDDEVMTPAPLEANFYHLYHHALTAAGINVASTKNHSMILKQRRTKARRMVLLVLLLVAFVVATLAAKSSSLFETTMTNVSFKSAQSFVSSSPQSKRTSMVPKAAAAKKQSPVKELKTPKSEILLHRYVGSSLDTVREWKSTVVPSLAKPEQSVVVKKDYKLKLLRPVVRQLQKLGRFLKTVASMVVRPRRGNRNIMSGEQQFQN